MEPTSVLSATRVLYDIAHVLDSAEEADARVRTAVEWLRRVVPYEHCALVADLPGRDRQFLEWPQSSETEQRKLREILSGLLVLLGDKVTADIRPFQRG